MVRNVSSADSPDKLAEFGLLDDDIQTDAGKIRGGAERAHGVVVHTRRLFIEESVGAAVVDNQLESGVAVKEFVAVPVRKTDDSLIVRQ